MQIFSFKLLNDCYTHFECVGAMPVALNATREVLQAQVRRAPVCQRVAHTKRSTGGSLAPTRMEY
eukprot:3631751-Rhodomonas_salina.2